MKTFTKPECGYELAPNTQGAYNWRQRETARDITCNLRISNNV